MDDNSDWILEDIDRIGEDLEDARAMLDSIGIYFKSLDRDILQKDVRWSFNVLKRMISIYEEIQNKMSSWDYSFVPVEARMKLKKNKSRISLLLSRCDQMKKAFEDCID
jgi:hypothetical protein